MCVWKSCNSCKSNEYHCNGCRSVVGSYMLCCINPSKINIRPKIHNYWWRNLMSWWRHHIETFSVLLAICAAFPRTKASGRVDVFFDLRLNKRLSKQSWGWWFETLSRPLWRHRNGIGGGRFGSSYFWSSVYCFVHIRIMKNIPFLH